MPAIMQRPIEIICGRGAAVVILLGIAALSLVTYLHAMTVSDVAWYLAATGKWLSGARLYDQIIEVNPPLIFLLNTPPVLASRALDLPAGGVFVVYLHLLIAGSVFLGFRIISNAPAEFRKHAPLFAIPVAGALCLFPIFDFGEREHFLVVFSLPYVIAVIHRAMGESLPTRLSVPIGLWAAFGFCLKPHFLLVPFLLEIYLMIQRRSVRTTIRAETVVLGIAAVLYLCGVVLFTPEYLTRIVPYARLTYGAFNHSLIAVLLSWQTILIPVLAVVHLRTRKAQRHPQIADVLLIGSAVFYMIYLVQKKTWNYHLLPAEIFSFLTLLAIALAGWSGPCRIVLRRTVGLAAVAATLMIPLHRGTFSQKSTVALLPTVRDHAAGSSIFVLSSYLRVGFPLASLVNARWPSRYPCLWPLPAAVRGIYSTEGEKNPATIRALKKLETYTIDSVIEDFSRDPPALVIVDLRRDPRFAGIDFDYVEFFGRNRRFADIWKNYRKLKRITDDGGGPYDIYVRATAETASR